jgi:hypothetical protein
LPLRHECSEVFRFVRVSLVLDQDRRLVVLGTLQRRDEVDQPQRGDVLALEESDEVGGGIDGSPVAYLHACWPAPVRRTYGCEVIKSTRHAVGLISHAARSHRSRRYEAEADLR